MKIAIPILFLLALLGVAYGLAFFGVIPAQKLADKSPALAAKLIALHLAKPKKPVVLATAPSATPIPTPEQVALDAQKQQVADGQAQLAKDRADFEAEKAAPVAPATDASAADAPPASPVPDSAAKLQAIYGAMSADDMATIFAKLPDPDVITALMSLDEKKAGKVLAALPPDRAARITLRMAHVVPPHLAAAPPASPRMSL